MRDHGGRSWRVGGALAILAVVGWSWAPGPPSASAASVDRVATIADTAAPTAPADTGQPDTAPTDTAPTDTAPTDTAPTDPAPTETSAPDDTATGTSTPATSAGTAEVATAVPDVVGADPDDDSELAWIAVIGLVALIAAAAAVMIARQDDDARPLPPTDEASPGDLI